MKTQDLFEQKLAKYEFQPIPLKTPFKKANKQKLIGQGVEADVFASSAPNTVVKIISPLYDTGYLSYLKLLTKHQDNPFFPKIHKVRVYTDPGTDGDQTLVVLMEKLVPLDNKKMADVWPVLFKQIGVDSDNINALLSSSRVTVDKSFASERYRRLITKKAKNPKFKEAMRILSPMFDRFGTDSHAGNWMIRLTGSGPQLVITDLFYGEFY